MTGVLEKMWRTGYKDKDEEVQDAADSVLLPGAKSGWRRD